MYLQSNNLLLSDAFENLRNMCLKIYELDPAKFFSGLGLAWQAALKKAKVKLDLLTDSDMLLMVEKCIREGICHSINRYEKVNIKCMKDYDKNKESLDVNKLYGWVMWQILSVNNFEWIDDTPQFKKYFIKKL